MRKKTKIKAKGVTLSVDIGFPIDEILDKGTVASIGQSMKNQSIKFMSLGISPVGGRKFDKYKNVEKYPKNVRKTFRDKKNSPVNLKLSGALHNALSWVQKNKRTITFGLLKADNKVKTYGAVHNRDDRGRPDIPERKFLPTKRGETFNRSIALEIKRLIVKRIKQLIK